MSTTGFTKKRLDLTITLGTGDFGETVGETVTLSGLRMSADMVAGSGDAMAMAQIRVFGLPQEMMNRLTSIGKNQWAVRGKNKILLAAGDGINGMQVVFMGSIGAAWADYGSQPDVAFNMAGYSGMAALLKPVNAISFKGSTDVAGIMEGLAKTMGLAFQNNGVNVKLSSPYFDGTALHQVRACAHDANINQKIENDTLIIWPKNGFVEGDIPLISPETGMIGYPSLNGAGMRIQTVFNSKIRPGQKVEIKSSIGMACGIWKTSTVNHSLACEMPGGPWVTEFQCAKVSDQ